MSILIFALVMVLIVALAVYAIDLLPLSSPFNAIVKVVVILIAILLLVQRAGMA